MSSGIVYTEIELVSGLRRHDNDAYRYLYMHYRGALYNLILQIIPEQETAADVLQEVFITVSRKIDMYSESKGRLFTWLVKMTRNTAINKLRSKLYRSQQQNEDLAIYAEVVEGNSPVSFDVNHIGLRQQVHGLREDYKNVIELSYYNGYTHEEIAKTLNIPLGTVKTRLRSALIELRKQFE